MYRIGGFYGEVKAKNMRGAMIKALTEHLAESNPPYYNEEWENIKIIVRRKHRKKLK